jgi:hypothetical protein
MAASPRYGRAINVNLTPEAREGWQDLADTYGADVTALLEVIGVRLAAGGIRSLRLDEIGRAARELSAARRRRST